MKRNDMKKHELMNPPPLSLLPPARKQNSFRKNLFILLCALLTLLAATMLVILLLNSGLEALEDGADQFFWGEIFAPWLTLKPASVLYDVSGDFSALETDPGDIMEEPTFPPAPLPPAEDTPAEEPGETVQVLFRDLSSSTLPAITNHTSYKIDKDHFLTMKSDIERPEELYAAYGKSAPVVLIVHTHGSESYREEGTLSCDPEDDYRTENPLKNVVAVGDVLAEVLVASGINTMHCTILFDAESYSTAYASSAAVIRKLTEKYPSIRYVLDVHRDALLSDDFNYAAVAELDGVSYAQFMMVIGTNEGGADHPRWKNCLSTAMKLQTSLGSAYPSLVRNISLRTASYNAQYAPISLLMEFGTCGNTLNEAKRTAVLVGAELAEIITGKECTVDLSVILGRYL